MDLERWYTMIRHPHRGASFGRRSFRNDAVTLIVRFLTSIEHFVERGIRANDVGAEDVLYNGF